MSDGQILTADEWYAALDSIDASAAAIGDGTHPLEIHDAALRAERDQEAAMLDDCQGMYRTALEQRDQAIRDRDAQQESIEVLLGAIEAAMEDFAAAEARERTLGEALTKYGQHLHDCDKRAGTGYRCTCGWDAALGTSPPADEPAEDSVFTHVVRDAAPTPEPERCPTCGQRWDEDDSEHDDIAPDCRDEWHGPPERCPRCGSTRAVRGTVERTIPRDTHGGNAPITKKPCPDDFHGGHSGVRTTDQEDAT